jgi:hypothetical protein
LSIRITLPVPPGTASLRDSVSIGLRLNFPNAASIFEFVLAEVSKKIVLCRCAKEKKWNQWNRGRQEAINVDVMV